MFWNCFSKGTLSSHRVSGLFSGRSCVIAEVWYSMWYSMDEVYFGFFGVLSFGAVAKCEGLLFSHLGYKLGFTITGCD